MRKRYKESFYNIWPSYSDILLSVFMLLILAFSLLVIQNSFQIANLSRRPDTEMSTEEIRKLERFRDFIKKLNENLLTQFKNDPDVDLDKDGNLTLKASVLFDTNEFQLKEESKSKLKSIGNKLKNILDKDKASIKYFDIVVKGHADNVGGERENWELSSQRAISVTSFLKSQCGLSPPAYKISAVGMGYFEPKVNNDSDDNRSKNRRIEIKIIIPLSMNTIKN